MGSSPLRTSGLIPAEVIFTRAETSAVIIAPGFEIGAHHAFGLGDALLGKDRPDGVQQEVP